MQRSAGLGCRRACALRFFQAFFVRLWQALVRIAVRMQRVVLQRPVNGLECDAIAEAKRLRVETAVQKQSGLTHATYYLKVSAHKPT
jgi:hypothetical protein